MSTVSLPEDHYNHQQLGVHDSSCQISSLTTPRNSLPPLEVKVAVLKNRRYSPFSCANVVIDEDRMKEREELQHVIESRIQVLAQNKKCKGQDVVKLSKVVEHLLFKTSSPEDLASYTDPSKLNARLVKLLSTVLARRAARLDTRNNVGKLRMEKLQQVVGQEKFRKLMDVTAEIRRLRLDRMEVSCASCTGTVACTLAKANASVKLPTVMPDAVKRLFLRTDLVSSVDQAPIDSMESLDWDGMMLQAAQNAADYKAWARKARIPQRNGGDHESCAEPINKKARFAAV